MEKKTYVYKEVGGVSILADVYRPGKCVNRPVVASLHGGCLINGDRTGYREDILELCRQQEYVLVSLDYRLGPEAKVPAIIDDLRDAIGWIRREGPALFGADPARLAVVGYSAGGYLTLMTGICVEPAPQVLVSYFGYGDIDGAWYTQPDTYYCTQVEQIAEADARAAVGAGVLTGTTWSTPMAEARGKYYRYLRQQGRWTREMTGFDASDTKSLTPYCPVRNVTADYPPTALLHGTEDTDVPCQQSAAMAERLTAAGVEHEFHAIEGAGHGLSDGDPAETAIATNSALAFIKKHLG